MLGRLYIIIFVYTIPVALLGYINSSYLDIFLADNTVGVLYAVAAFLTILFLSKIPILLAHFGHVKLSTVFLSLSAVSILGMLSQVTFLVIACFILLEIMIMSFAVNFDMYIEKYSRDESTGVTRGSYFSIINLAFLISPLLIIFILRNNEYWRVYLLAIVILVFVIFYSISHFKKIGEINYKRPPFWKGLSEFWQRRSVRNIFLARFTLQFFFAWMVIYTPIYLHNNIGFEWDKIGIIFSIMLLPYVLFELPLGYLADKRIGEKELLVSGLLITAVSTGVLSFLTSEKLWIWALVLFFTRVGASFVEIMTETYFFKKVKTEETSTIAFFRDAKPLAYLIGPLLASILLSFMDMRWLFFVLGFIVLSGAVFALRLKDTL